jgi:NADH-quinone oxidoreductase subunit D
MSDEEEDQSRDEPPAHVGHRSGYSEEIEDLEEQASEDIGLAEFGSEGFRTVDRERHATETAALVAETSEGAQELLPRSTTGSGELRREVGAVLRLPEGNYVNPDDIDIERRDDETMIINMGPQHPSTHGVLRLMLELDGETVLRTKPIIGYLHTGMEKTGEELTYVQGATNVTRMDYLSPLTNELVFSMATEALLEVELPPRAVWIRMLMAELQRVSSHLMWMATNGMDLGSTSMMIYGFREREMVLAFFEKTTGLRMNHNYIRPGGVAADLPDGWQDDVAVICDTVMARTFEYDELLTGQPIFRERTEAVGNLTAEEALALSVTGPVLRSTGVPWDLRRTMPYLDYDKLDFDVIVGKYGDNFDRYSVRLNEIRESIKLVRQIAERMPAGDYRVQDRKVTPPPRARIDESMEALIHHFKIFTEGFRVPEGEVYVAIESPRGELGCYMVSDGTSKPYRMHIRGPSFVNLQALPVLLRGGLMADAVAVISSVDPVMGEVDR